MSYRQMVENSPQFVHSQFVDDITLADRVIEFFNAHPYLHAEGLVVDGDGVNSSKIKKSREIYVGNQLVSFPVFQEFNQQLEIALKEYLKIYPRVDTLSRFSLMPYNIQFYKPEEGFFDWHCEITSGLKPYVSRVLAFTFYCNTLEDGGTEFLHQDFTCKSEKGKLCIFPTSWTFTHRGEFCTKGKMIVTGWWNFEV